MYIIDPELVMSIHKERLRMSRQMPLYQQVGHPQPGHDAASLRKYLRQRLGDLVIAFGNWLKGCPAVQAPIVPPMNLSN